METFSAAGLLAGHTHGLLATKHMLHGSSGISREGGTELGLSPEEVAGGQGKPTHHSRQTEGGSGRHYSGKAASRGRASQQLSGHCLYIRPVAT